jgi:hypothetical protein
VDAHHYCMDLSADVCCCLLLLWDSSGAVMGPWFVGGWGVIGGLVEGMGIGRG